jgi:hydrogenase expression/formation protein HypE
MKFLPLGKLKLEHLQKLLRTYTSTDDRVVIGSQVGEDAAVIAFGDTYLVAKTDPITFVADDIGWYTIVVNANDIATRGAIPKWFLATILLPENRTTEETVETIFAQLSEACHQYQITFCGGHTEVTYGIDRPIVIGQMLGEVAKDKLITTSGAQVGDDIILTKGVAVEATSIIARVKHEELCRKYSEEFLQTCKQFIHTPGISVIEDALLAVQFGQIHAMHDPTEGGLATGLHEIAEAAGVGVHIDYDSIAIFPETDQLCREYHLDPLGVIASGALVLTASPQETSYILDGLTDNGIQVSVIGRIVPSQEGRKLNKGDTLKTLPIYEQDEITKIFD